MKTKQHQKKRNLLDFLKIILIICIITSSFNVYSQLTTYTNAMPGIQWVFNQPSSEHDISYGEDWFYNVIETSDGGFVGVGYSEVPADPINAPTVVSQLTARSVGIKTKGRDARQNKVNLCVLCVLACPN